MYRNIKSLHTINQGESDQEMNNKYFFNTTPEDLYESEVIASHYYHNDRVNYHQPIQEDIYSDLDLT